MRLIGHLNDEAMVLRLSGVLQTEGIAHEVEADGEPASSWAVWVIAEEDLQRAAGILAAFRANPNDPRFGPRSRPVSGPAPVTEDEELPSPGDRDAGKRPRAWRETSGNGEVTLVVILACVGIGLATRLSEGHPVVNQLQIAEKFYKYGSAWSAFLPEVRSGQIWRLFTPALLHFGWPHLLFNLWTFWDLGRAIEWRRGSGTLAALVIGLAIVSNLGQYFVSGPGFGGLSGVIYGLLGYVWMLGKHRPDAGLALHPQMVVMMLVWFVICLSGALGVPVANTAHGVGLVAGMWWGRVAAGRRG